MKTALLAILAFVVLLAAGATLNPNTTAAAEESKSALFLPAAAEQYLPLESPVDMAMNDSYLVIADKDGLYIFDRAQDRYERYAHTSGRTISKVQFAPDGRLYFSDQDAHIYEYDFSAKTAVLQNNVTCSTFVIDRDMIYMAVVTSSGTTFYALPLTRGALSMDRAKALGSPITSTSGPRMFVLEGVIYCAVNNFVHAYTYQPLDEVYSYTSHLLAGNTPVSELSSVCVFENELYYTVNGSYDGDGIYRTRLDDSSERLISGKGFAALSACEGRLFAVESGAVRELKKNDDGSLSETGYEISSSSASPGRLSGAEDTVRARDLLAIADRGNGRVVLYDLKEKTFSALPCGEADRLATDGELIAVSLNERILLYHRGQTEPYATFSASGPLTGLAVTNGVCYYTCGTFCGKAEAAAEETLRKTELIGLTCDLYGNLYAVDGAGQVTRYTETEFLDRASQGERIGNSPLPNDFRSLRADLEGNLYYLSGGALYRNGTQISSLSDEGLLYHKDGQSCTARSFALGFEDGDLYVQYGDHMIRTEAGIEHLGALSAEGIPDALLAAPTGEELQFTDVPASVAAIEVDLTADMEGGYFEAVRYLRTQGGRGVKLGETGRFALVALYEEYSYRTLLFLKKDCKETSPRYLVREPATRYLSSEVGMYRYPCVTEALELARLPRGTRINLLGEVRAEDGKGFSFGYAELSDGSRGYVPLGYLSEYVPAPGDPESYTLGYLKANADGVTFRAESGETITVTERTQVRIYDSGDGRCFVRFDRDGVTYTGQVTRSMIESGNPNALRMSLIIFLCVLAVGILAAYVILVPKKKRT